MSAGRRFTVEFTADMDPALGAIDIASGLARIGLGSALVGPEGGPLVRALDVTATLTTTDGTTIAISIDPETGEYQFRPGGS